VATFATPCGAPPAARSGRRSSEGSMNVNLRSASDFEPRPGSPILDRDGSTRLEAGFAGR
jgi:hypothetical protein